MSRPLVFVFPGQSSRDPEMFARAALVDPDATTQALADFERLAGHPFDGTFETNTNVQLAVHLVTRIYRARVARAGLHAVASAGLSLGEYAHLIHIGALPEHAADTLIAARGRRYDAGPHGMMVAVTPADVGEIEAVLETVRAEHGIEPADLAISNFNSPRQLVIAGRSDAVEAAVVAIERDLFAITTVIEKRVPMHVGRFEPVATAFSEDLSRVPWRVPHATWWSNVRGGAIEDPTAASLVQGMRDHVARPVRWASIVDTIAARHPGAVVLEVGPARVLTGLLARGRHPEVVAMSLDTPNRPVDIDARIEEVRRACT